MDSPIARRLSRLRGEFVLVNGLPAQESQLRGATNHPFAADHSPPGIILAHCVLCIATKPMLGMVCVKV
jgi:hypothetical protein